MSGPARCTILASCLASLAIALPCFAADPPSVTLNQKADGYRGIWYMNQPSKDEYVYKYSGGLGTYCAKHQPFAVHCPAVRKTFFCFGGTWEDDHRHLLHMVSYFDHATGMVPRPTLLLDKQTDDAHDNPVISVDDRGYLWIFSTSHGTSRPSYLHRSREPYSIDAFDLVEATRVENGKEVAVTNFSYMQAWHVPGGGFACFFTRYRDPVQRTIQFMTSPDGIRWDSWQRIAAFGEGHYQISAAEVGRAGAAFNYHPQGKGLNWRTNLYYVETTDFGLSWHTAGGQPLELPLVEIENPAIVQDTRDPWRNVYLKDIRYDADGRPVILYLTSLGYESGPNNDPRTWTTARWTGERWEIRPAFTSDNNYDMGSLWIEADGAWRVIGPTQTGPQPYNPGGEVAAWISRDQGGTWELEKQLTTNSPRNHTYVRRPVGAHPDFYALWADGHGRQPSLSQLYFCDREGRVYELPRSMSADFERPQLRSPAPSAAADPPRERPVIREPWWQIAGDPDLGSFTSPTQQPVDFAIWQAADGTWQLWSCIRNTHCGGKTRLFHRWEGQQLTDANWQPMGIAMQADPAVGETPGGLQAPHVIRWQGQYWMFYGDWQNICLARSADGKNFQRVLNAEGRCYIATLLPSLKGIRLAPLDWAASVER